MAVKIRLARHGAKGKPFYWIMIADARSPRETGKEKVGTYNPLLPANDQKKYQIKEDRIRHWLSVGAQPTDRVKRILSHLKLLPEYTIRQTPQKSAPKAKAQERAKEQTAPGA